MFRHNCFGCGDMGNSSSRPNTFCMVGDTSLMMCADFKGAPMQTLPTPAPTPHPSPSPYQLPVYLPSWFPAFRTPHIWKELSPFSMVEGWWGQCDVANRVAFVCWCRRGDVTHSLSRERKKKERGNRERGRERESLCGPSDIWSPVILKPPNPTESPNSSQALWNKWSDKWCGSVGRPGWRDIKTAQKKATVISLIIPSPFKICVYSTKKVWRAFRGICSILQKEININSVAVL